MTKNREGVQRHREKKKLKLAHSSIESGITLTVEEVTIRKMSISPLTLGRAKRRVLKYLPKSPRKRKVVLYSLARDNGITTSPKAKRKCSDEGRFQTCERVKEFYLSTSWMCPGLKDCVTVKEDGAQKTLSSDTD